MSEWESGKAGKYVFEAVYCVCSKAVWILVLEWYVRVKENGANFTESGVKFEASFAKAPKQCEYRLQK